MHRLGPSGEIDDILAPYLAVERTPLQTRPWVMANMVTGLDGSGSAGGTSAHLSGPTDRQLFLRMRAIADVVLVGAATVRAENYGPARLSDDLVETRVRAGRPRVPRIAVVTGSLDLDPSARFFEPNADGDGPIVFTSSGHDPAAISRLADRADVREMGEGIVDLGRALENLRRDGVSVVLNEGGPSLLGQLVAHGLLDELCLTISPRTGGDPLPVMLNAPGAAPSEFRLAHALAEDSTLFLRYECEARP